MKEIAREHWNLYYLFLWDRRDHPMPQQVKLQIMDALFATEEGPESINRRENGKREVD